MLNANHSHAPGSPAAILSQYDTLCTLAIEMPGLTSANGWRLLAADLTSAAASVPSAFAAKYSDRAADCLARARRRESASTLQWIPVIGVTASEAARS